MDHELVVKFAAIPPPVCLALTPFEIIDVSRDGLFEVEFEALPAFGNHFGNVQGGLAVALIDVLISGAVFARTGVWAPTIEIKTSFLEPLPIAPCRGIGRVVRAGERLAFTEATLFTPAGAPAVTATASALVSAGISAG